jgi:hypothetical protein
MRLVKARSLVVLHTTASHEMRHQCEESYNACMIALNTDNFLILLFWLLTGQGYNDLRFDTVVLIKANESIPRMLPCVGVSAFQMTHFHFRMAFTLEASNHCH